MKHPWHPDLELIAVVTILWVINVAFVIHDIMIHDWVWHRTGVCAVTSVVCFVVLMYVAEKRLR